MFYHAESRCDVSTLPNGEDHGLLGPILPKAGELWVGEAVIYRCADGYSLEEAYELHHVQFNCSNSANGTVVIEGENGIFNQSQLPTCVEGK